ncbi:hypothetical protein N803_07475 [Knoellia subterranea KCTC 19937]|uniref:CBS domain-containing protein n=2 Tax=Knoellia TaxID=136099 RepID=A0A0A0JRB5_9MICO|nr:hypothetical protein N803_07475 [Knoellia subterranea KCTC 19937]
MTSPARSLHQSATVDDAIELLGGLRISAVPVVDDHGRVIGIVSEADLLRDHLPRDPRAHLRPDAPSTRPRLLLAEVMSSAPTTVTPVADCSDVAQTFAGTSFKSLPVVDDQGLLLGVVSRSDLVRVLSAPNPVLADAIATALAIAGLPPRPTMVQSGHVTLTGSDDGLDDAVRAVVATVPGVRSVDLV